MNFHHHLNILHGSVIAFRTHEAAYLTPKISLKTRVYILMMEILGYYTLILWCVTLQVITAWKYTYVTCHLTASIHNVHHGCSTQ